MSTNQDDWAALLSDHPIFDVPKTYKDSSEDALELSTNSLKRRQAMALKDADLIVAVHTELRMTSLGDTKLGKSIKSYKVLHTPNIQFEIHQIITNPGGKLLAVAGAYQVAVVVLPRPGYSKLVSSTVDCKSVQVGQFYHASTTSIPIAKIEWHPWGEAGSTLMVMTVDGKLREYDISVDTEEPQQVLSFLPEKKPKSFIAEDPAEREIASFTLGRGKADWGDVYGICPYMPKNASVPSSYVHALECFIAAKQEFLLQGTSTSTSALSTLYDYQRKYVSALVKQLPPGTVFPAVSRPVPMHLPHTIKSEPLRQGPFLLQPSPRTLEGSEGGDATDIACLAFTSDDDEGNEGETERLGIVMIAYQDGKVDVCLDVEKVEARWESKQESSRELPMFAVYESVDLGLISMLGEPSTERSSLDLLQANHPVLYGDPMHDDRVYVAHAFGVHALDFGELLQCLSAALRADDERGIFAPTHVTAVLDTFSVQRRCSKPVIAICVPNDIFLAYSILILTSVFRIICLPLTLRTDLSASRDLQDAGPEPTSEQDGGFLIPVEGPPAYVCLLEAEPFQIPPMLSRPSGLPSFPRMSVGTSNSKSEFMLTPDTLRYFGSVVESFIAQIREVILAHRATETRAALQVTEFQRQQGKEVEELRGLRYAHTEARVQKIMESHKSLTARLDRTLQLLMQQASPDLSESETKWFEELRRMRAEVFGAGRYDEGSLAARISLLKREYERNMSNLKNMAEKESQRRKQFAESSQLLGISQAFELGERSHLERTKISELEKVVAQMASKLDLSIGRPPSELSVSDSDF
ncbi:hypothetical protein F5J12DRAFT_792150 [Pisolithus orientalis]|uniref:uncharacterized protein n=1 Tax=Pisolithus orientalis TaxID=936130 RepID=UPI002225AAA5|nr:uncharacterized protein F5J12DRAFT_792150 [Pisolithus orientalis]KAI6035259.1 hypothetical protein F5J12DRAFT_792150 [Pisolithus orientalis]